jgi:restriction system protein
MARRSKSTPLEDIFTLVSLMPWWAGLIAAALSYALFYWLSAPVPVTAVDARNVGSFMVRTIISKGSLVALYVVPLICIAAAIASALHRLKPKRLFDQLTQNPTADKLSSLTWAEFELLVGEAFRLDGFEVEQRGGAQADGGVDLVLRRGGEKFLVQCKQWRATRVGVAIVRELFGVMAATGATGGFVVTSGTFTNDATAFAEGRNVILVDGKILLEMIERAERVATGQRSVGMRV